jgi:hypothetical protein
MFAVVVYSYTTFGTQSYEGAALGSKLGLSVGPMLGIELGVVLGKKLGKALGKLLGPLSFHHRQHVSKCDCSWLAFECARLSSHIYRSTTLASLKTS